MRRTDAVIIGGGQAGLAMSRWLAQLGIDHVVLERGRVAERWRSESWDALRLLSPNWQTRLPGYQYSGPDPDGYMTAAEVVDYLQGYARAIEAPVLEDTTVTDLRAAGGGYHVTTSRDSWSAPTVVIATGHCETPFVPPLAGGLSPRIAQVLPTRYRNPQQLPDGGVLVVGASSTGVQLADEIHASGRPVTLAVGRHTRLPRSYRGRDILWWLDAMGVFDETSRAVRDLDAARRQPSLQLVGRPDRATLDLRVLQARGVRLAGRLAAVDGSRARFADDLVASTAAADARLARVLQRVDAFVEQSGHAADPAEPFEPFLWPRPAPETIDLQAEGIRSVVWATGFTRRYPWLQVPVLDAGGEIRHDGGVTAAPGLYVIGLYFMRRRKSSFIDGVGEDARELAGLLAAGLRLAA
jgi:putative flavoprotein involved in K+ transport